MPEIVWLGSTHEDLIKASQQVRSTMGAALRMAQDGQMSDDAEPMKGELRDVVEIGADDEDGTYRLMYTVKIGDDLIVLDFFKKKSKSGIATPKADLDRILYRLKRAREQYARR